ncbi:dual specificity protein phosphatase-like protein [Propionicimonas paludicola]|uniref:Dual specificity protein phosphatase-like protein n=1 Tax=Propionicimonas paludicola TaxID=185243 RepID=A0A2A9CUA0_9ACTN|nr:dual specificity protein phosphatase [Propionicimonas paludicola]PFG18023.1 dual specificity protein phosphatase-like protein [Propionicimonas paludicola]
MTDSATGRAAFHAELTQGFALANADFVTQRIAVGGDLSANFELARRQLAELSEAGITHIIDLRAEWTDESLVRRWEPGIRYLYHPVDDDGAVIPGRWFDGVVEWARQALADPEAKLLVHCHMGVNRAPSVVLAILLDAGMGVRPALEAIRTARPVAAIDYAGSVLAWWSARLGHDARTRRNARRVLQRWRAARNLDVEAVIRTIRNTQQPRNRWTLRLSVGQRLALADLIDRSPEVAAGLVVGGPRSELAQLDEVLLLTAEGLCGRALVVGPVEPGEAMLPVKVTELFEPIPVLVPERLAGWLAGDGPVLRLLHGGDYAQLVHADPQTLALGA